SWGSPTSLIGPQGDQGIQGDAGSSREGIRYTWDTGTSVADPGAGILRANNASLSSTTVLVFDEVDAYGAAVGQYISNGWGATSGDVKGHVLLRDEDDIDKFAAFAVTGITAESGWVQVAVEELASNLSSFTDEHEISVTFAPAGDEGAAGDNGDAGAPGAAG